MDTSLLMLRAIAVAKFSNPFGIFDTARNVISHFYRCELGLRPGFVLFTVTSRFINEQLRSLNPEKAIGLDNVSPLFLCDGADFITNQRHDDLEQGTLTELTTWVFFSI